MPNMSDTLERRADLGITEQAPALPGALVDQKVPNAWELLARRNKAERLASMLFTHKIPSSAAVDMDLSQWRRLALAAGVKMPSLEAQVMAVGILRDKEKEHGSAE